VLGTRGGVVFASTAEGEFGGAGRQDRKTAVEFPFQPGVPITASPMSYAVDGQEFVAVSAGNMVYSFALPWIQPFFFHTMSGWLASTPK
jgi:hypothetical protein